MALYDVAWYMQYEAETKEDAALQAFADLQDKQATLTIFNVSEPDDEVNEHSTAIDCQDGKAVRVDWFSCCASLLQVRGGTAGEK